jgi:hypothetical protein
MNNTRLTARPHAFAGAILAPRHAKELTPTACLAIAAALADQNPKSTQSVPYTCVAPLLLRSVLARTLVAVSAVY